MTDPAAPLAPETSDIHEGDTLAVTPELVRQVGDALDRGRADEALDLVGALHAADVADLLEALNADDREDLIAALGAGLEPEVLADLDEHVRDRVLENIEPEEIAAAAAELDTDDATYLIEDLDEEEQRKVLDAMPAADREMVEAALAYPEESAGRLMQRDYVAVPSFWTVGQVIDWLRETEELPDEFYEIFIVDPRHRPIGTVPLYRAMRNQRSTEVAEIMDSDPHVVPVDMDQEDVAYQFDQYNLASAPVVGPDGRLLGQITVDDVVDVIQEEAEEDIHRLGGVSAEGDLHLSSGSSPTPSSRWWRSRS